MTIDRIRWLTLLAIIIIIIIIDNFQQLVDLLHGELRDQGHGLPRGVLNLVLERVHLLGHLWRVGVEDTHHTHLTRTHTCTHHTCTHLTHTPHTPPTHPSTCCVDSLTPHTHKHTHIHQYLLCCLSLLLHPAL